MNVTLEAWKTATVSVCVLPCAETERLVKDEEEASKAQRERANLPRDLLSELCTACKNYAPDQIKMAQGCHKPLTPPVAACKLAILPEAEGGADCAILAIKVPTTDLALAQLSSRHINWTTALTALNAAAQTLYNTACRICFPYFLDFSSGCPGLCLEHPHDVQSRVLPVVRRLGASWQGEEAF